MKLKYEFTVREIMGEYALIPMGESAVALSGMLLTNAVGAFVCELLAEPTDQEALLKAVLDEFDIDEATARNDIAEFLDRLAEAQLLTEE